MYGVNNPYSYQNYMNPQYQQMYNYGAQVQQGNQTQTQVQQNTTAQVLKGRPVTSLEEARACMIDLDGSIFVFPDTSNKRIYTKQIMLDGSAEIKSYVLEEPEQVSEEVKETKNNKKYVLKSDYDKKIKNLNDRIDSLMKKMEGMADDESDADV